VLINRDVLIQLFHAAKVYDETHGLHTAERFVEWLCAEYGMEYPK
jgi:hypothetical protein